MRFTATVQAAQGGGHMVEVPVELAEMFASKRPAVVASIRGVDYRTRLMVYGRKPYLGLRKDLLAEIEASVGDAIEVDLSEDPLPRVVDEPKELCEVLASDPSARRAYDGLSYSHQREFATWVGEAKKAETRVSRALKARSMLLDGHKAP